MKSLVLLVIVALSFIPSSHSCGSACPSSCHSCPPDWIRWKDNCYKYHSGTNLNFREAEALCNQLVPFKEPCSCPQKAHLASIESAEENTFLLGEWRKVRGLPSGNARFQRLHIGYTDEYKEGRWQWVDGSSSTYTNWDMGEPNNFGGNEHCGIMWNLHDDNGRWNDEPCSYRNSFFCKFRLFYEKQIIDF